jgi:hypothetical protein
MVARSVNLSVSGMLLYVARRYRVGECLEWEIDCLVKRGMKTILRGAGEVVRNGSSRRPFAAIQFDSNGASLVRSERAPTLSSANEALVGS